MWLSAAEGLTQSHLGEESVQHAAADPDQPLGVRRRDLGRAAQPPQLPQGLDERPSVLICI